ncbi:MAG: hypothetical protein JF591_21210, partial [Lysobacter sp.]|nr:hypothetical protein [Lysobacter sp.]
WTAVFHAVVDGAVREVVGHYRATELQLLQFDHLAFDMVLGLYPALSLFDELGTIFKDFLKVLGYRGRVYDGQPGASPGGGKHPDHCERQGRHAPDVARSPDLVIGLPIGATCGALSLDIHAVPLGSKPAVLRVRACECGFLLCSIETRWNQRNQHRIDFFR